MSTRQEQEFHLMERAIAAEQRYGFLSLVLVHAIVALQPLGTSLASGMVFKAFPDFCTIWLVQLLYPCQTDLDPGTGSGTRCSIGFRV